MWYLPDDLVPLAKLFSDDAFLFSTVYDPLHSAKPLNDDLKVSVWACKWKMLLNPGITN